jgi:hypothetical protein
MGDEAALLAAASRSCWLWLWLWKRGGTGVKL